MRLGGGIGVCCALCCAVLSPTHTTKKPHTNNKKTTNQTKQNKKNKNKTPTKASHFYFIIEGVIDVERNGILLGSNGEGQFLVSVVVVADSWG